MSAQRYRPGVAHERMTAGLCPECGQRPETHGNDPRFWMPSNVDCGLLEIGVAERIEQYSADQNSTLGVHTIGEAT